MTSQTPEETPRKDFGFEPKHPDGLPNIEKDCTTDCPWCDGYPPCEYRIGYNDGFNTLHHQLQKAREERDKEIVEAIDKALLTKSEYAEHARGWGAEGSDRYLGYIDGAMDVNGRVFWELAGVGIQPTLNITKDHSELDQPTPDLVSIEDKKQTNLPDHSELDQDDENKMFQASSAGDILKELDQDKL